MDITTTQIASRHVDGRASSEWFSRPDDERYLSLQALHDAVSARRNISRQVGLALQHTEVAVSPNGASLILTDESQGMAGKLTHDSFGKLCQRVGAPAGYLRDLPAELAAVNLTWGLQHNAEDARALVLAESSGDVVRAVTSDSYGRIWDAQLTEAIMHATAGGDWQVPAASYAATDPKRATTLYASDRDVFVFLVDPTRPIEVPGESSPLFRGFYAWNSETGDASLGVSTFLYRYVCDNRNIWGQHDYREIKVRHSSGAPVRMARDIQPQLNRYVNSSTGAEVAGIKAAIDKQVGVDKPTVLDFLRKRGFTAKVAEAAYTSAETSGANPRSVWGLVNGITDVAHDLAHTDARVDLERKAGKLMEVAA